MQVLEHQHRRSECPQLSREGRHDLVWQHPTLHDLLQLAAGVLGDCKQRAERTRSEQRIASTPEHPDRSVALLGEAPQKRGLPCARLAAHEHDAAPGAVPDGLQALVKRRELALALQQHGRCVRGTGKRNLSRHPPILFLSPAHHKGWRRVGAAAVPGEGRGDRDKQDSIGSARHRGARRAGRRGLRQEGAGDFDDGRRNGRRPVADDAGRQGRHRAGHVGDLPRRGDARPDPGVRLPGEHGHHRDVRFAAPAAARWLVQARAGHEGRDARPADDRVHDQHGREVLGRQERDACGRRLQPQAQHRPQARRVLRRRLRERRPRSKPPPATR